MAADVASCRLAVSTQDRVKTREGGRGGQHWGNKSAKPVKSDQQEWQSLEVLNGTNIFLNGTNISFLKFIGGSLNRGTANSFWNHVIQISSRQMYFQDIYSNLWKVRIFRGNIYSLKSNTYFWGTVMFVLEGFLYLIVTRNKLPVCRVLECYL